MTDSDSYKPGDPNPYNQGEDMWAQLGENYLDEVYQPRRGRSYSDYRRRNKEVGADVLAQYQTNPRGLRRDYPKAYKWAEQATSLAFRDLEDDR